MGAVQPQLHPLSGEPMTLLAQHARACVEAIRALPGDCSNVPLAALARHCSAVVAFPVGLQGRCSGGGACADGAGECIGDTCAALGVEGQRCLAVCAEGHVCVAGQCQRMRVPGAPCDEDALCPPPTVCRGTCEALREPGLPCVDTQDCAVGLACVASLCATRDPACVQPGCASHASCGGQYLPRCVRPPESTDGGPLAGSPCENGQCGVNHQCGPGDVCQRLPLSGEPCGVEGSVKACAPGLACRADNTCGSVPQAGEPCAYSRLCVEGARCETTGSGDLCVPGRAEGEACDIANLFHDCALGLFCDYPSLICTRDFALGEPCLNDPSCQDGAVCDPDPSGGQSCRLPPSDGERCHVTCAAGLLCADAPLGAGACQPFLCETPPPFTYVTAAPPPSG